MTTFATVLYWVFILSFVLIFLKSILILVGPFASFLKQTQEIGQRIFWEVTLDKFHSAPVRLFLYFTCMTLIGFIVICLTYQLFDKYLDVSNKDLYLVVFIGGVVYGCITMISEYLLSYFKFKKSQKR